MWNMYLEREDSKVVGKRFNLDGPQNVDLNARTRVTPRPPLCARRSVCWAAEELGDLRRLWLQLHRV